MKKRDLVRQIADMATTAGLDFALIGGTKHEKYKLNNVSIMIPRHAEIGEQLAKEILKQARAAIDKER